MKVVYCHNREVNQEIAKLGTIVVEPKGGSTVAMEAIPSWLLDNLQQGDSIVRKIGIARCSEDDNYCKKTGRELAFSRLKQKTLTVINLVKFAPTYTIVFFEDEDGNLFEVKKSSDPYCARLIRMLDD
jgi:hypothetical protein